MQRRRRGRMFGAPRTLEGVEANVATLTPPVDLDRDHVRGPAEAAVTLVEYGDYQCPYCGQAEVVIRQLLDSFGDELRYVWRHLPLNDVHANAQLAAEAAEAAADQSRFWEMHDKLLAHQDELTPPDLGRYAEDIGLDLDAFWSSVRRHRNAERIADDVASADASGVAGTPTFFVNGQRHQGAYDVETLRSAVQRARNRARVRSSASA
jgi:protein-disulfide isomerase